MNEIIETTAARIAGQLSVEHYPAVEAPLVLGIVRHTLYTLQAESEAAAKKAAPGQLCPACQMGACNGDGECSGACG